MFSPRFLECELSNESENPWLINVEGGAVSEDDTSRGGSSGYPELDTTSPPLPPPVSLATGPGLPQPFVAPPDEHARLASKEVQGDVDLWWVGVHGGSGESTLAAVSGIGHNTGHMWPHDLRSSPSVVLVARTHYSGLVALQNAATHWASGKVPVKLLGGVLVADAPGKLPRPLQEMVHLVTGGLPRTWIIPWVPAWRFALPDPDQAPLRVRSVFRSIHDLVSPGKVS